MKYILLIVPLLISLFSFGQQDSLTVKGVLKGLGNLNVNLTFYDDNGKYVYYKAPATDGHFSFKVKKQSGPMVARFNTSFERDLLKKVNGINYGSPAPQLPVFIYKTDINIAGAVTDLHIASVTGDIENNEFAEYLESVKEAEKREWDISATTFSMDLTKDSVAIKKLTDESAEIQNEISNSKKRFIDQHPGSFASMYLLSGIGNHYTAEAYKQAFDHLTNEYKLTGIGKSVSRQIERLSVTAVGKPAIPFLRKDKDGNEIDLSGYKGKVVLLDFWGSWCGPCRASHPHLKALYSKYKDKGFEIIAIASENAKTPEERKAKWLAAIKEDGTNWVHILNNDGMEKQDLVNEYRIDGFPTKILLGKNGKVLLRITASATNDIDNTLREIFDGK